MQSIFYLIGYKKEDILLPKTNLINWKYVRNLINKKDLIDKVLAYNHRGPKP